MENAQLDPKVLIEIVTVKMPFGKYKDILICDIPVSYLEWMHSKGFPPGRLGMLLATVFEMKTNGLGDLLYRLKLSAMTGKQPGL